MLKVPWPLVPPAIPLSPTKPIKLQRVTFSRIHNSIVEHGGHASRYSCKTEWIPFHKAMRWQTVKEPCLSTWFHYRNGWNLIFLPLGWSLKSPYPTGIYLLPKENVWIALLWFPPNSLNMQKEIIKIITTIRFQFVPCKNYNSSFLLLSFAPIKYAFFLSGWLAHASLPYIQQKQIKYIPMVLLNT